MNNRLHIEKLVSNAVLDRLKVYVMRVAGLDVIIRDASIYYSLQQLSRLSNLGLTGEKLVGLVHVVVYRQVKKIMAMSVGYIEMLPHIIRKESRNNILDELLE